MEENSLLSIFTKETLDNLQILEEALLSLENNPNDEELLDQVFRAMHSIKGGTGLVNLDKIGEIAHKLENILEDLRQKDGEISEDLFNYLFEGMDIIREMINSGDYEGEDIEGVEKLISDLDDYEKEVLDNKKSSNGNDIKEDNENSGLKYYKITLNFRQDIFETGTDPIMLLMELDEIGDIKRTGLKENDLTDIYKLDPYKMYIGWELIFATEESLGNIRDIFIFVMDENEIEFVDITSEIDQYLDESEIKTPTKESKDETERSGSSIRKKSKTAADKQSKTIRVEADKLEEILNDIAELLIAQSRVKELTSDLITDTERSKKMDINSSFEDVDKLIRKVQEEVMNASMIPISGVFTRMQRMVRDISRRTDKKVNLVLRGKETELDRKIIEQLADPLKHLVRNAIDHGLELPEVREEKGKPATGTIVLEAFHQEGNIVIKVSDDGAGINKEKVIEKAINNGVIESGENLSDEDIHQLIFKPGFSTAEKVSDISGRGVGLDVVKNNINGIRGNISLDSKPDQGSTFTIKLPLTLAIIDGMIIEIGVNKYVLPLTSIVEFVDASRQKFSQLEGKGMIIQLREEYIPYLPLYKLLDIPGDQVLASEPGEGLLVILSNSKKKIALQVDEIIGKEQVVIKNVKENIGYVQGVTGAAIMGDGNVSIILDGNSLFNIAQQKMNIKSSDIKRLKDMEHNESK